jgi:hypothetical protein
MVGLKGHSNDHCTKSVFRGFKRPVRPRSSDLVQWSLAGSNSISKRFYLRHMNEIITRETVGSDRQKDLS